MSAMLLDEIAQASTDVAATRSKLAKVARLAEALGQASTDEIAVAVAYLSGFLPQGTIGVGWAALREPPASAASPTLELLEVHAAVSRDRGDRGCRVAGRSPRSAGRSLRPRDRAGAAVPDGPAPR